MRGVTMFRVRDGRKKRKSMVVKYAAKDPFVGVLVAAADFEWTCRRAILAMGEGSTLGIRYELFEQWAFGLKLNKGWEGLVRQKSKGIAKFEDIFSSWAKKNSVAYVLWADIEYAMGWRNKLIHGIEGSIGEAEGRKCVNILECACDILLQYVNSHNANVYSYIGRRGELSSRAIRKKQDCERRENENKEARRIGADECEVGGVRIKRTKVQAELGISAKKLDEVSLWINRNLGI